MEKRAVELDGCSQGADRAHASIEIGVLEHVARLMRLLKEIGGALLGGIAVSAQVGNVLICVFMILVGPAFITGLLSR